MSLIMGVRFDNETWVAADSLVVDQGDRVISRDFNKIVFDGPDFMLLVAGDMLAPTIVRMANDAVSAARTVEEIADAIFEAASPVISADADAINQHFLCANRGTGEIHEVRMHTGCPWIVPNSRVCLGSGGDECRAILEWSMEFMREDAGAREEVLKSIMRCVSNLVTSVGGEIVVKRVWRRLDA